MEDSKREEVLSKMSEISEIADSGLERNQTREDITYYHELGIGNSGIGQKDAYVVKIMNQRERENGDDTQIQGDESSDQYATYAIYDKDNNLIAKVDEKGNISFSEEYRAQIERKYGALANNLNLDSAEMKELQELSNKDLSQSKEELTEYKEKQPESKEREEEGKEQDGKEKEEEEKEESPEQETEEDKKEKTAEVLGIKPEDIKSISRIDPNQRVSETETIRDIIPEAAKYKELQISCTNPTEKSSGIFTIIGVNENGEREILNSIDPIEGVYGDKNVISMNEDGSQVTEKQVKGLFQINSGNRTNGIAISIGDYGMMNIDYVQNVRDKETRRAIPIRTKDAENQRILSREMEEQARDTVSEVRKEGENFRKNDINPKSMDGIDEDEADGKMSLEDLKENIKNEALEQDEMSSSELREFIQGKIEDEIE